MRLLELMYERVRSVRKAIGGSEFSDDGSLPDAPAPSFDELLVRFAELEWMVRQLPELTAKLPPFGFSPPADVSETDRDVLVEVAVSGIERQDVAVEVSGRTLVVAGAVADPTGNGRVYVHAELPRGPFSRRIVLPSPVGAEPRVEIERGLIRIRLNKLASKRPASA